MEFSGLAPRVGDAVGAFAVDAGQSPLLAEGISNGVRGIAMKGSLSVISTGEAEYRSSPL